MRRARPGAVGTRVAAVAVALLLLGGCASTQTLKRADAYAQNGEWDAAITYYQQRLQEDPGDQEARRKLLLAKTASAAYHRAEGNKLFEAGDLQRAQMELELAVRLDPGNQAAVLDLQRVNRAIAEAAKRAAATPTEIQRAIQESEEAPPPVPKLEHRASGKMTFDYRRAKIMEIYRALGRLGGINVLFDPDLDNPTTSFFMRDVTYEHAWEVLTATHGHFFRVMSPNTLLVAPDNQQKRRQYEPQVLRTFYLSNADPEQVASALQTILQARQVTPIPSLNAVTIRDTASVVEVAERVVRSLDKSQAEVLLQIEIFEVDRGVMNKWGLSLSDYSTTVSIAQQAEGLSFSDLNRLSNQDVFITVPSLRYQFLKQDTSFKLIAQPQLRASDGQASSLLVGEQRPVVTTTFNPQATVGGNVVPISSTEYRDVGILIEATPRVHHDRTITLQLGLQVTAAQEGAGTFDQPVFTARNLTTTLRLKEGETNLLAGLLRDEERKIRTGFPLLSKVPLLRDLLGRTETELTQTDIVLAITPYIVRLPDITPEDLRGVYVGTEANISGGAGARRSGRTGRRGGEGGEGGREEAQAVQEPLLVSLQPQQTSAAVGSTVTFEIVVQGDAEMANAGLRVGFDPAVLRLVEAREGTLLSGDGADTSFQSSTAQGSVAIGVGRVGNVGGIAARGTLATLVFEAVGAGESRVQVVSAALRDVQGRPLPVQFEPAVVRVQ